MLLLNLMLDDTVTVLYVVVGFERSDPSKIYVLFGLVPVNKQASAVATKHKRRRRRTALARLFPHAIGSPSWLTHK